MTTVSGYVSDTGCFLTFSGHLKNVLRKTKDKMMRAAFHENYKEATEKDYAQKAFQNSETHQWTDIEK